MSFLKHHTVSSWMQPEKNWKRNFLCCDSSTEGLFLLDISFISRNMCWMFQYLRWPDGFWWRTARGFRMKKESFEIPRIFWFSIWKCFVCQFEFSKLNSLKHCLRCFKIGNFQTVKKVFRTSEIFNKTFKIKQKGLWNLQNWLKI